MISVITKSSRADGEDRLVLDRPGRYVAGAGRRDERGHRLGRLARVEGEVGLLAHRDEHDHRLADGARDREHERRDDAGDCGGDDDPSRHLHLRRAERVGAVAQIARHRAHRVLGQRRDGRHQHHAHHEPRGERVEDVDLDPEIAQQRRHEGEREVAEDDRRDAREDLERRLQDPARAGRRVLAQVDRGAQPERHRDCARDRGDEQRAGDQRQDAEVRGLEQRRPVRAGQEVDDRDLLEELERRHEQSDDDPDRGHDRDQRADGRGAP